MVTGILYGFDIILIMEVSVTRILHFFETDNYLKSKRCMSGSSIGMGLVTGMLTILIRILEGMVVIGILFNFAIIIITVVL